MHPADIKASLSKCGTSQVGVARSLKNRFGRPLTQAAVFHVIHGVTRSSRIARRISEVTGIPVAQLWPGKYPLLEAEQKGVAWAVQASHGAREQLNAATRGKPRKAA